MLWAQEHPRPSKVADALFGSSQLLGQVLAKLLNYDGFWTGTFPDCSVIAQNSASHSSLAGCWICGLPISRWISGIMENQPQSICPFSEGQRKERVKCPQNQRRGPEPWGQNTGSYWDLKAWASKRLLCGPKWGYYGPWPVNIGGWKASYLAKRGFLPESALFYKLTPSTILSPLKCLKTGKAKAEVSHPVWEDHPSVLAFLLLLTLH